MGFCTDEEYEEFLRSCPVFEEMLVRSGIILLKYWFSVSDEEQERRFVERMREPDQALEAEPDGHRGTQALGRVLEGEGRDARAHRHQAAPWFIVEADDKKRARLNCIAHLLSRSRTRIWTRSRWSCRRGSGQRLPAAEEVEAALGDPNLLVLGSPSESPAPAQARRGERPSPRACSGSCSRM